MHKYDDISMTNSSFPVVTYSLDKTCTIHNKQGIVDDLGIEFSLIAHLENWVFQ